MAENVRVFVSNLAYIFLYYEMNPIILLSSTRICLWYLKIFAYESHQFQN